MSNIEVFKENNELTTAVLFLVFNRLETTKVVFESIRRAKPKKLYISSDGSRESRINEDEKVKEVRDYLLSNIDWPCDVKTLFREKNLGCKYAVSSAIDWFFKQESMGIILEDDCLPSQSFFFFCQDLLEKYKDDMRVWHISGDNFQDDNIRGEADYYFSRYNHVWGWASWADRWSKYDVEINSFPLFEQDKQIKNTWSNNKLQKYWLGLFSQVYNNRIDTWDYQWTYTCWLHTGASILPNKNMIKNIGFGEDATHTIDKNSQMSNLKAFDLLFPLKYNEHVVLDDEADKYTTKKMFAKPNICFRLINKISRMIMGKNLVK